MRKSVVQVYPAKGTKERARILSRLKDRRDLVGTPKQVNPLDGFDIPDEMLMDAAEQTCVSRNVGLDRWKTSDRRYCKSLCPGYGHVDEDDIQNRATDIRKLTRKGIIKRGRKGREQLLKESSGEELLSAFIAAYPAAENHSEDYIRRLSEPDYPDLCKQVMAKTDGKCPCGRPATTCHHIRYDRMRKWQEIMDMVALCATCHPIWDARRRQESQRTNEAPSVSVGNGSGGHKLSDKDVAAFIADVNEEANRMIVNERSGKYADAAAEQ